MGEFLPLHQGRPATSPRLVVGLMYLQHAFKLSDEAVVALRLSQPFDPIEKLLRMIGMAERTVLAEFVRGSRGSFRRPRQDHLDRRLDFFRRC